MVMNYKDVNYSEALSGPTKVVICGSIVALLAFVSVGGCKYYEIGREEEAARQMRNSWIEARSCSECMGFPEERDELGGLEGDVVE